MTAGVEDRWLPPSLSGGLLSFLFFFLLLFLMLLLLSVFLCSFIFILFVFLTYVLIIIIVSIIIVIITIIYELLVSETLGARIQTVRTWPVDPSGPRSVQGGAVVGGGEFFLFSSTAKIYTNTPIIYNTVYMFLIR